MRLTEILRPPHIVAPLPASNAAQAVAHLAQVLVDDGAVERPEALARLVAESRARDLIHVGGRVLLPHLRTDAVSSLVVAMGIAPEPLPSGTGEAEPEAQVVVLVLAPPSKADLYLQTVAALARVLRHDHVVDALVAARSPEEVLEIPEIRDIAIAPRLTVRDVMTPRVFRVGPETPISEVLDVIAEHGLRAVPVVGEDREVLGMVTERELLRHFLPGVQRPGDSAALRDARARDVMSRSVICVSEDQALADVTSVMVNKDVERVPVTGGGKLTGFLTRGDILRKLFGFKLGTNP